MVAIALSHETAMHSSWHRRSVHAGTSCFFAILERVRLVALVALIDLHVSVSTHRLGHKVFGEMARRGLMALRADFCRRRGMQKRSDTPGLGVVAACAIPPEQLLMRVLIAVAAGTIEGTSLHPR